MTTHLTNKRTAGLFIIVGILSTPVALYGILTSFAAGLANLPGEPEVALAALTFNAAMALGYMLFAGYMAYARGTIRVEKIALLWKGTIAYNLCWAAFFLAITFASRDIWELVWLPIGQLGLAGLGARAYIRDMWALAERGYDAERLSRIFA